MESRTLSVYTETSDFERAVDAGLGWPADGQTSTSGDEHRQPDGGRLTDERQRIGSQSAVHPRHARSGRQLVETDVRDEVPQREVDEPDQQERVVGQRQRPQQQPRNRQNAHAAGNSSPATRLRRPTENPCP